MENFGQFISEFYGQFVGGLVSIFKGIYNGFVTMFNVPAYVKVASEFKGQLGGLAIVLAVFAALILIAAIVGIIFGIIFLVKKKSKSEQSKLSNSLYSQEELENTDIEDIGTERFYRLMKVDEEMENYVVPEYDNDITLPEIIERFRNFCSSRLGLYYEYKILRLFLASFASTRLIILQGISGTGKTSLPYAFGKFIQNDAVIASVQPSWRDRSELFGYFNEFTKRYTETELLTKMYEAKYNEDIYVTILDEMNIARVEYYFAEMLSILEMPTREEWIIDLVPSVWETDPKLLEGGKMKLPENMWYIGTANNDDSTFTITDKVYDRAMPIDINTKGKAFSAPLADPMNLSYKHLESMLNEAKEKNKVSDESIEKIEVLDDYVIEHFRLAFGNRIVKQLREFVPAFVGCGGTEIEGIDYVLAKKVFRKFDSMNISYIRDEIDGLCDYLDELFGVDSMMECKEYLQRIKKG